MYFWKWDDLARIGYDTVTNLFRSLEHLEYEFNTDLLLAQNRGPRSVPSATMVSDSKVLVRFTALLPLIKSISGAILQLHMDIAPVPVVVGTLVFPESWTAADPIGAIFHRSGMGLVRPEFANYLKMALTVYNE